MQRIDDFQERRKHLARLSEEELEGKFWQLAGEIVQPLLELASKNTSPSIERSVLLRMGFSSIEANAIVDKCAKMGLLGKGAGNIVLKLANEKDMDYLEAGRFIAGGKGLEDLKALFQGGV
ncbi:MAG TPA: ornithine aminomutase subunit alpha [bacterium]|nr:ornithine aminomutase subunit alpha [bacterium]